MWLFEMCRAHESWSSASSLLTRAVAHADRTQLLSNRCTRVKRCALHDVRLVYSGYDEGGVTG